MVSEYDPENLERPRGMFSTADREYLLGESAIEAKTQAERNRRARIRERLTHTLLDFTLVAGIEQRDRDTVFQRDDDTAGESQRISALHQSIMDLLGFLYQELENHPDAGISFEECLRTGILRTRFQSEGMKTVSPGDVTFKVDEPERVDIDSITSKLGEHGLEGLTEGELRTVLKLLAQEGQAMSPEDMIDELEALNASGTLDQ